MLEFAEALQASALSVSIQSSTWLTPLLQSIHILMIGVVFVSIVMIALRVLGRVRSDEPFEQVWRRFTPWMWSGLAVMALTGLILIINEPVREFTAFSFWLKMLLIALAVGSAALFGGTLRAAAIGGGTNFRFSVGARCGAVATIGVWVLIIFLGRAIAYDVQVWGASLSPIIGR